MSEQPEKPSSKGSKPKTNMFAGFVIDPSLLTPPDDAPALSIASDNVSVPKRHNRKQPGDEIDLNPAEVQVKTTADDDGEPPPMKKAQEETAERTCQDRNANPASSFGRWIAQLNQQLRSCNVKSSSISRWTSSSQRFSWQV